MSEPPPSPAWGKVSVWPEMEARALSVESLCLLLHTVTAFLTIALEGSGREGLNVVCAGLPLPSLCYGAPCIFCSWTVLLTPLGVSLVEWTVLRVSHWRRVGLERIRVGLSGNSRDACKYTKLRVPIQDEDRRGQHLAVGLIDFCYSWAGPLFLVGWVIIPACYFSPPP